MSCTLISFLCNNFPTRNNQMSHLLWEELAVCLLPSHHWGHTGHEERRGCCLHSPSFPLPFPCC